MIWQCFLPKRGQLSNYCIKPVLVTYLFRLLSPQVLTPVHIVISVSTILMPIIKYFYNQYGRNNCIINFTQQNAFQRRVETGVLLFVPVVMQA